MSAAARVLASLQVADNVQHRGVAERVPAAACNVQPAVVPTRTIWRASSICLVLAAADSVLTLEMADALTCDPGMAAKVSALVEEAKEYVLGMEDKV